MYLTAASVRLPVSDRRASPRVLRLHFKVAIRSTPAVRLTGCSSFLRFIRNSRFRRINALPGAHTNAILVEIAAFESTFEKDSRSTIIDINVTEFHFCDSRELNSIRIIHTRALSRRFVFVHVQWIRPLDRSARLHKNAVTGAICDEPFNFVPRILRKFLTIETRREHLTRESWLAKDVAPAA